MTEMFGQAFPWLRAGIGQIYATGAERVAELATMCAEGGARWM